MDYAMYRFSIPTISAKYSGRSMKFCLNVGLIVCFLVSMRRMAAPATARMRATPKPHHQIQENDDH
jgi:hypothetical protein